jgi:hypothetical protein
MLAWDRIDSGPNGSGLSDRDEVEQGPAIALLYFPLPSSLKGL